MQDFLNGARLSEAKHSVYMRGQNTGILEEDMKIKVLLPYLRSLGYVDEELRFENGIDVQIGTKKTKVYSDIEVIINGKV